MLQLDLVRHQLAIAGRVTDAQTGRSIGRARVTIIAGPAEFTTRLEVKKMQYGTRWAALAERPDRTRTAADGHFHFVDLPDGAYTLTASLPGSGSKFGAAQGEATVSRNAQGNISLVALDIALPPTTLKGRITYQDAEPVVMAEVRIKGSGERVYTDGTGNFRLAGLEIGERTVLISARGYQPSSRTVALNDPGTERVVEIVLVPRDFNPTRIESCALWLKADAINGLSDGEPVETWPDHSGNGYDATQVIESARPIYRANAINGRPALRFDGVDDFMALSLFESATDHTFLFVYSQTPAGGHSNYLFDAQQGRLALDSAGSVSPYHVRWLDDTWHDIAPAIGGDQILTWVFSGNAGEVFRNGAPLGTAPYSPKSLRGNVTLGSNYGGHQSLFSGDIAEVVYYNRALSAEERRLVEQYLNSRYGIPLA